MLGARASVVTVRTSTLASARSNSLAVGLPRSGDGFSGAMTLAALPLVMANDTIEKLMRIANVAANGQNNPRELLAVARRRQGEIEFAHGAPVDARHARLCVGGKDVELRHD
jgi:hypothetical protein